MDNLIIIGDPHTREESPYNIAVEKFTAWIDKQPWNNPNNVGLFLGDIFHKYMPTPPENDLAIHLFKDCLHFKKIIILCGNHDRKRDINALEVFNSFKNVQVIYKPTIEMIENISCLFLPHYDPHYYSDLTTMKQDYIKDGLVSKFPGIDSVEYVFGHFSNSSLFGEEIDTSWLPAKKVLGHVHVASLGKDFIGTPYITRSDEKGQKGRVLSIDLSTQKEEYIPVPVFMDYKTIKYGERLENSDITYFLDIEDAPDEDSAKAFYEGSYIHKIRVKGKVEKKVSNKENSSEKKAITEYVEEFFKLHCTHVEKLKLRIRELTNKKEV